MENAVAGLFEKTEAAVAGSEGFEEVRTLTLQPCRWCNGKGEFRFLDKDEKTGARTHRVEVCSQCNGFKVLYRVERS